MNTTVALTFSVLVPDGEPDGLRIIEKWGWVGQCTFFPRTIWKRAKERKELSHPGVYMVWGNSEDDVLPRTYIGEGEDVLDRLDDHNRTLDFWTHAVSFTSMDNSLNKAHIKYLEAKLLERAKGASRCTLENSQFPPAPTLSEAVKAQADHFLADLLLCLPLIGIDFFEIPLAQGEQTVDLLLQGKGITAHGYEDAMGFVVRTGSRAVKEETNSISSQISKLRKSLIDNGVLEDTGQSYLLVQDYAFKSPSAASDTLLAGSTNGRIQWKDANGITLKTIQDNSARTS